MSKKPTIGQFLASLGEPYEDDGTCEICNHNGPTWDGEEPVTLNRYPLCANCAIQAHLHGDKTSDE